MVAPSEQLQKVNEKRKEKIMTKKMKGLLLKLTLGCLVVILCGTVGIAQQSYWVNTCPLAGRLMLLFAGTVLLLSVVSLVFNRIKKCTDRQLRIICTILFALIAVIFAVFLCSFRIVPFNDSHSMLDQALYMSGEGNGQIDEESIYHNYFAKYSNNYFLTICFIQFFRVMGYLGVTDLYLPLYILNAVALYLGCVFTYLIAKKAFGRKAATMVLLLSAMNPVYYGKVFWVYSNTLSVPFFMGCLYLGVCIFQEQSFRKRMVYGSVLAVLTVCGYYIRPTSVFPVIALAGGFLLYIWKKRRDYGRWTICFAVWGLIATVAFVGVQKVCNLHFGNVEEGNYPVTHWLMMGSHDNGRYNVEDDRYTQSLATAEEKKEATLQCTLDNYQKLGVLGTVELMGVKLISVWSDGYFSMDSRMAQNVQYNPLYSWLVGEDKDCFQLYCQCFWLMVLSLVFLSVLRQNREGARRTIPFMMTVTLFGGFAFYCLWEVKQDYAIPFLYLFLLLAQDGAWWLQYGVAKQHKKRQIHGLRRKICMATGIVFVFFAVFLVQTELRAYAVTQHSTYSIRCFGQSWLQDIPLEKENEIVQTFYPEYDFNRITLAAREKDEKKADAYLFILQDYMGRELYQKELTNKDIDAENHINVKLPVFAADSENGYRLVLRKKKAGDMYIRVRKGLCLDTYKGNMWVCGKPQPTDLYMSVAYCEP